MDFVRPAENGLDYDVHVRQDSNAPKHRLWFHFQMQGGSAGDRIQLGGGHCDVDCFNLPRDSVLLWHQCRISPGDHQQA